MLMTTEDVARELCFSPKAIRQWARSGLLPSVKFGRFVRFNREDIELVKEQGLSRNDRFRSKARGGRSRRSVSAQGERLWER